MASTFKKTARITGRAFLAIIAFIISYILVAIILSVISIPKEAGTANDVAIYILTNGDHTDIIVPVKDKLADWTNEVKYAYTAGNDTTARYLALGWGDKGFFINTPTWAAI